MLFKNAPIIIPTLNRYDHLKRCVESLANNPLAKESELVISLDYPPHEKYREGWEKIKEYLPTIVGFGKVTVLCADENIGAAKNCNKLRSYVKGLGYDAFILTEDDNVFAPNFLDYMNWGLRTYKNDKSILAICGYKRVDLPFLKNNIYQYPRFNAWGYGMWFDRREKLDQLESRNKQKITLDSYPIGSIFSNRIFEIETIMAMYYKKTVWGDALPFMLPKEQQNCIFPKISLVRNEGFDGSGLHNRYSKSDYTLYHKGDLDKSKSFTPLITEPLYSDKIKKVYASTYKKSFKPRILAIIRFFTYKFSGRFFRFN